MTIPEALATASVSSHQPVPYEAMLGLQGDTALDTLAGDSLDRLLYDFSDVAALSADVSPAQYLSEVEQHFRDGSWNAECAERIHDALERHIACGTHVDDCAHMLILLCDYAMTSERGLHPDGERVLQQALRLLITPIAKGECARQCELIGRLLRMLRRCELESSATTRRACAVLGIEAITKQRGLPRVDAFNHIVCGLINLRNRDAASFSQRDNAALTKAYTNLLALPRVPWLVRRSIVRALLREARLPADSIPDEPGTTGISRRAMSTG